MDGVAYFASGRSSFLDGGIFLFAADVVTGRILKKMQLDTADAPLPKLHPRYLLDNYTGYLNDILTSDGNALFLRNREFSLDLESRPGSSYFGTDGSFLDSSYFIRIRWRGSSYLMAYDGQRTYSLRFYPTGRYNSSFVPGTEGYRLVAAEGPGQIWQEHVPIRVVTMASTPEVLFVGGPPDLVGPTDPLGAFEGRKGGLLWAIDADDGKRLSEIGLNSPPVFNGMAAARGDLYVSCADGSLLCLGKGEQP
jgi:hypothetical protein